MAEEKTTESSMSISANNETHRFDNMWEQNTDVASTTILRKQIILQGKMNRLEYIYCTGSKTV